jgi:hypothetical protein
MRSTAPAPSFEKWSQQVTLVARAAKGSIRMVDMYFS